MVTYEDFRNITVIDGHHDIFDTKTKEFDYIVEQIKNKTGHVLEFGVYQGFSINHISGLLPERTVFGFDSFEGLPEDWDHGTKYRKKGHFATKVPKVNDNVVLYIGWFDDKIPQWLDNHITEPIDFLHVDSDLYSSAKVILNSLNTSIVPGTIIRFDDFCDWRYTFNIKDDRLPKMSYTNWRKGEYRAFMEWQDKYNREVVPLYRNWDKSCSVQVVK